MGLKVRLKTVGQSDPPDLDLLEIVGVPFSTDPSNDRTNIALGLVFTVCEHGVSVTRPIEENTLLTSVHLSRRDPQDRTLVEYLRWSFQWGGFPGWEKEKSRPEKELALLRVGLLPI